LPSVSSGDYERHRDEGTEATLKVIKAFKHPNYNRRTVDNDIALLRLETPAPFSNYIVPACLPGREMAERVLHLNNTLTVVTGWGKDDVGHFSSALNVIKVPLVSPSICRQHMSYNISENVL
uniref:vitamin K-dependent protein C-like n=1 Tax=Monopterus albus TaxID=43700 RepID=UPI0009B48506